MNDDVGQARERSLTEKEQRLVDAMCAAAVRGAELTREQAGTAAGYGVGETARVGATRALARPPVQTALQAAMHEAASPHRSTKDITMSETLEVSPTLQQAMERAANPPPPKEPPQQAAPFDPGLPWRARVGEIYAGYVAEGMHIDFATPGAWWKIANEVIDAGLAIDIYGAEIVLGAFGINAPRNPPQRWILFRNGDQISPGTNWSSPTPAPEDDTRPAPGWSPIGRGSAMRPVEVDAFMELWSEIYGSAEVQAEELDPRLLDAIAGSRIGEWEPHQFAGVVRQVSDRYYTNDGRRLVGVDSKWDHPPTIFALRQPGLKARTTRDPSLQIWADRLVERVTKMRDDPEFMPGKIPGSRIARAVDLVFGEIAQEYADAKGMDLRTALLRLDDAGVRL